MEKSIFYFSMAAKQNHIYSQCHLGNIFLLGKLVSRNVNKAIYYYTQAANQKNAYAQYTLGKIYYEGKYVTKDVRKGMYYLQLSADQNYPSAQYIIGCIFYNNCSNDIQKIKKGQNYIFRSLLNGNKLASFVSGFIYHEGRTVKRDINRSIRYYKEASSFNIQYAKNNLGIIYKNGFGNEIEANTQNAIIFFEEAIKNNDDSISKFNLANIYLYDENDIDKSINLLIDSCNECFHSFILLSLALVKKHDFNLEAIQQEEKIKKSNYLFHKIMDIIYQRNLLDKFSFKIFYEGYRKIDFLYNATGYYFYSFDLYDAEKDKNIHKNPNLKDISSIFYEGFGF